MFSFPHYSCTIHSALKQEYNDVFYINPTLYILNVCVCVCVWLFLCVFNMLSLLFTSLQFSRVENLGRVTGRPSKIAVRTFT